MCSGGKHNQEHYVGRSFSSVRTVWGLGGEGGIILFLISYLQFMSEHEEKISKRGKWPEVLAKSTQAIKIAVIYGRMYAFRNCRKRKVSTDCLHVLGLRRHHCLGLWLPSPFFCVRKREKDVGKIINNLVPLNVEFFYFILVCVLGSTGLCGAGGGAVLP